MISYGTLRSSGVLALGFRVVFLYKFQSLSFVRITQAFLGGHEHPGDCVTQCIRDSKESLKECDDRDDR